ncbi:MAG: thiol reductant ABC exporter subunit CydC, partial [Solirubrobacteraceae bacterium]|nr:thiol reductant ABC exporter subunit CydC [Solirubrobacteraceae bacterium]
AAAAAPAVGLAGGPAAPRATTGTIRLVGVTVDGGAGRPDRLHDVDVTLPPGTTTALVGPSGAGKTTLAHLVLGLLPPAEGQVLVGDVDLQRVAIDGWHAHAAWVPQDPVLLPASLRDNARLAAPTAGDDAVLAALDEAGLGTLVSELPSGLDTALGEGGARLSSGELRRLALARALLSGADLLVLDEPTAQLDALTAERLLGTIAELRRGRTTLLITHDPAVAATADQVLELDAGKLVRTTRTAGFAAPVGGYGRRGLVPVPAGATEPAPVEELAQPVAPVVRISLRTALRLVAPARGAAVWRQVGRAVGLGVLSSIAAVAVLALSGGLIVQAATQPPVLALTALIVLVRLFSILRSLGRYGERLQSHEAALVILESARVRVFDHVARHVPGRWSDRSAEALDGAVGDVDRAADLLVRVVVPGAAAIAAVDVATIIASVISPVAGAVLLGSALVVGGTAWVIARQAGTALAEREPVRAALARDVVTALDAGPELLLAGRVGDQQARIARQSAMLEQAAAAHGARGAALGGVVQVGAALGAVLSAAVLAPSVASGALGYYAGAFAAGLVLGTLAAIERLEGISEAGLALPGAAAAVARLAPALLEVGPADNGDAPASAGRRRRRAPWTGWASLQAEHVAVERGGRAVLRDASLTVQPGEVVALSGESGCGKSTLFLTLSGLLRPAAGSVRIGARELRGLDDESRSDRILLVPSAPHLFGGSLAANLRVAAPDATERDLRRALRAVGLEAWLDSLPHGLDEVLGEGGATASGGQRQRIGLARAILSPAAMVLLDEPASHLPEADATAALRAVLRARPGRTAVLVTHRAAERRLATREVRLEGGSCGTPAGTPARAATALREPAR